MTEHNEHPPEEGGLDTPPKEPNPWYRLPYLVLFAIVFEIVQAVVGVVAVVQFVLRVATGHPNGRLRTLGGHLGRYVREVVAFLTFESDAIPYPFGPWPEAD